MTKMEKVPHGQEVRHGQKDYTRDCFGQVLVHAEDLEQIVTQTIG